VVYLLLPFEHARFPHRSFQVPKWLGNFSECVQVRFVHDAGPATKLLGAMQFEDERTSAIITVDDDKVYHQRMLEVLLDAANLWHGSAVGFAGVTVSATSMCMYQRCIDDSDDLPISNWLSWLNTSRVRVIQHDGLSQGDITIGGYEDSTSLHAIRSSKQLAPWHPEEMRKSASASYLEVLRLTRTLRWTPARLNDGPLTVSIGQGASSSRHAFNLSSESPIWKGKRLASMAPGLTKQLWLGASHKSLRYRPVPLLA